MAIHSLTNQSNIDRISVKNNLKLGQILPGKVIKLYPNQHAQIQFANEMLHAQLKKPLIKGERYHFRVEQTDGPIVLKVIGGSLEGHPNQNASTLLHELGLTVTKQRIGFIMELVRDQIPFRKEDLTKAFQLMETANQPVQGSLKQMIIKHLPLTQTVLEAVSTAQTATLINEGKGLYQALLHTISEHPDHQALTDRLGWLLDRNALSPKELLRQILHDITQTRSRTFRQLQTCGAVAKEVKFETWQSDWGQFMSTHGIENPLLDSIPENVTRPLSFNETRAARFLKTHPNHTHNTTIRDQWLHWEPVLKAAIHNEARLPDEVFEILQTETRQLMPSLDKSEQSILWTTLTNSQRDLKALYHIITKGSNPTTLPMQSRFISHIQTMLQGAGLSHEFVAVRDPVAAQTTIKSLLIQLVTHHQDSGIAERALPLLHLINGLQLDTVQESSYALHAALQLPGEKLGLQDDFKMEFSSRKKGDGKVDPDDCTILFHLHLANMKRTMIDMHIQKRTVALTIWTESSIAGEGADSFQPALQEGLRHLDYHLSSITFKTIDQSFDGSDAQGPHHNDPSRQIHTGVDVRI